LPAVEVPKVPEVVPGNTAVCLEGHIRMPRTAVPARMITD